MSVLKKKLLAALSYTEVRYVIAGGSSFLLNFAIFYLCHKVWGLWYVYATMLAGSTAWLLNFPLHKFWTFGDHRTGALPWQGAAHFSLKMWNTYLWDPFLLYLLVEYGEWDAPWGKVAVSAGIGLQNYLLCRYLIFCRPA